MFKKLFCHHDLLTLKTIKDDWFPTFHTTNGLDDEDTRQLIFTCDECGKRLEKTQIRSHGMIINFRDVK